MPSEASTKPLISFAVTPRFEIFYALRALSENSNIGGDWRRKTGKLLPKSFPESVDSVAPRPIMWALLADSLRHAKPDLSFPQILDAIQSLDDYGFQSAILSGVFRDASKVEGLIAGRQSLRSAIESERKAGTSLVELMGLYPFKKPGAVGSAFTRIISEPGAFRADLSQTLDTFWQSAFSDTWNQLEPRMQHWVEARQAMLDAGSLRSFARDTQLPVTFDERKNAVVSTRGGKNFPYDTLQGIHVIPSAFNDGHFWAAYSDPAGLVRLYFPIFDRTLLKMEASIVDPALGFRALGDTTRYAMAFFLANSPRTSVELARQFSVSKATISHHVQLLRSAGLIHETGTDRGVVLALNREVLEQLSRAAADEMFNAGRSPVVRRSRREGNSRRSSE
jgi:DNA-binding transcriptional ArsR family regulator